MKSLAGSIVITWPAIVASNAMSAPALLVSLSVTNASTLASVITESSRSRTASSNVIVTFPVFNTPVAPFNGLKVMTGPAMSPAENVAFVALSALS